MREQFFSVLTVLSRPAVSLGGALIIGAGIIGFAWHATTVPPLKGSGSVLVTVGPITEEVDVSGIVKAAQSTNLAFQTSGRVAAIHIQIGDHVEAGQTLVVLDNSSQTAAVALAQANLKVQQANLAALIAGTRPKQLAIDQTAVTQATNALTNALMAAYTNADDAVHVKADQVFSNPRNSSAALTIVVPNATLVSQIQTERIALEPIFSSWNSILASTTVDIQSVTAISQTDMQTVSMFLNNLATALAETPPGGSISATTLTGYQTNIDAGRLNVSAALSALIAADTAYKTAIETLILAQAGATTNNVSAQKASVDAAQASVDAAEAAASQAIITAPFSGTITAQNANLGETVTPGVTVISMMTDGKYQADAQVSEIGIAEVKVGDTVEATFATYPGVTFPAMVTTIDPAATMSGGAASYGITVTFLNSDPRLFPGLSANLRIITATKNAALIVPTSSIITNGNQKFVYVENAKGVIQTSVTVGIESSDGMTEIVSGLAKGDAVLVF